MGQTSVTRVPTAVHAIDAVVVSIGRAPENTVVLNDLLVSRRHALLRRRGRNGNCMDNHSANGTYVNGNRITRAVIGPHDIVGIGHQLLHLSGERLVEYVDTGDISYEAANLRVHTKGTKSCSTTSTSSYPNAACWPSWDPPAPANPPCWAP